MAKALRTSVHIAVVWGFLAVMMFGPAVGAAGWETLGGDITRRGQSNHRGPVSACVKWRFELAAATPFSIATDGEQRTYIACEDGVLYALDPNGALLWTYDASSPFSGSPTAAADGSVYIGNADGRLHIVGPNGTGAGAYSTGGVVSSSPAVARTGNVYFGSHDGNLYAISPDGDELWTFATKGPGVLPNGAITASPAIGADGTVYVGGLYDPNLYALDPNDGSVKWVCCFEYLTKPWDPTSVEGGWPFASPVVGPDGTIYQTLLHDPNLYAIDPNNGDIRWKINLANPAGGWFDYGYADDYPGADGWSEPVVGPDGTIYVSFDDPYLRAVNPDGTIHWVTRLGRLGGFTLTVDAAGMIYAAGDDGYLYVVDSAGWQVARFKSDNWLNYPVVAADGTAIVSEGRDGSVLIADQNNYVWAFSMQDCQGLDHPLRSIADIDGSGEVDFADLARLLADWFLCTDKTVYPGMSGPVCSYTGSLLFLAGDVDQDGYVFFSDLFEVADVWLGAARSDRGPREPGPFLPPQAWPYRPDSGGGSGGGR